MASERGAANIRKFNAEREQKNLALVERELKLCSRRKLQFKSIGLLAAHLSDRTGIHRTTLLRNTKYKVLLAVFMRSQPGAAAVVDDGTDDPYVLKVKLASAQAEVGTLREEVKRLTTRLSNIEPGELAPRGTTPGDVDFSSLCMLLSLVLVRAQTFGVDNNSRSLIDLAARPSERVVGGPERAGAFVDWLEQNAMLPFVAEIKRL